MQLREILETKGFVRVPLKAMASGHYSCVIKLNGIKGTFIVDTGASTSCIGFDFIDYFKLKSIESDVIAAGAGATDMKTQLSENNKLTLGKHITQKMNFVLFDLSHVNKALSQIDPNVVHGIIGADYLKNNRAVIDYGRNCLYLK
ncbi:MAG: retropepsin-like aspartic protease [Patiriisocius sp.]|uniref:retropepsin-like aspartic protease n=1 Tax=Patiriisocius sp. TaxID=2822396 RepID=UPI003EF85054